MKLRLERFEYGDTFTIGKFYIDSVSHCFSLEDKVRQGEKVNVRHLGQISVRLRPINTVLESILINVFLWMC